MSGVVSAPGEAGSGCCQTWLFLQPGGHSLCPGELITDTLTAVAGRWKEQ